MVLLFSVPYINALSSVRTILNRNSRRGDVVLNFQTSYDFLNTEEKISNFRRPQIYQFLYWTEWSYQNVYKCIVAKHTDETQ